MNHRVLDRLILTFAVGWCAACAGNIEGGEMFDPGNGKGKGTTGGGGAGGASDEQNHSLSDPTLPGRGLAATGRLRRLTVNEYDNTVRDLLSDKTRLSNQILPNDSLTPFDNDYTTQAGSDSVIATKVEILATDAVSRLLADPTRRNKIVGCTPTGPGDSVCLADFIKRFGRKALRRSITTDDVQSFMALQKLAQKDNDFYSAAAGVIEAMLQHPEFLYRVESGTAVPGSPGLFKLNSWEMATRLSYLLWGTTPDDALLKLAEDGMLAEPEQVRAAAAGMLAHVPFPFTTARPALERLARFHAMWFGYDQISAGKLTPAVQAETGALLGRVLFDKKQPWQDLLRSTDTYVNYDLAKHYGLSLPAGSPLKPNTTRSAWVSYAGTKRQGLFSHATFLSMGSGGQVGEKMMTIRRGKLISERLLCTPVPPPPPDVAAMPKPAASSPCKKDLLAAHRSKGTCAACHKLLDTVGLGLDNYDQAGAFRQTDTWKFTNPEKTAADPVAKGTAGAVTCNISGDGELDGQPFNGPAELADLTLKSDRLNGCVVTQFYKFALGRAEIDDMDKQFVDMMSKRVGAGDFRFDEMLLDFVSSDAFAHRRQ